MKVIVFACMIASMQNGHFAGVQTNATLAWKQIGAKAGTDTEGDSLAVSVTAAGARLHCVFQHLDGEATLKGLWLTSTVPDQPHDRFRVKAVAVGRGADLRPAAGSWETEVGPTPAPLPSESEVSLRGRTVQFARPMLIEEYSVGVNGVRQDFVVQSRPTDSRPTGARSRGEPLRVELAVTGATVEQTASGIQLALPQSGRKIAYSRLKATDANGNGLSARIALAPDPAFCALSSAAAIAISVDDADAVYPVRIDPTFSDANWIGMGGLPGANGPVRAAVADGSGNVYIGGSFTAVGEVSAANIARWNGSAWSPLSSGISGTVYALAISGTNLYAGGEFAWTGDYTIQLGAIAKWDGESWSALDSGMSGGLPTTVCALAVSGGDLYAGGAFTTAGGSGANWIAKWDGSSWSALGSGVVGTVYALAVLGNNVYAGGGFMTAGTGSAAGRIAKWNGSAWSMLGSGVDRYIGSSPSVRALAISGSDLYVGGFFTAAGGSAANCIAKWSGTAWGAIGSGLGGYYPSVSALAISGTNLYAGGDFTTAGGSASARVAKWNGDGWSALGSGMDYEVLALAASDTDLYAGGSFTTVTNSDGVAVTVNHVARWNGSAWSALGSGMNSYVQTLAISGTNLYAGGHFTTAGSGAANHIAKWEGNAWSALSSGVDGSVYAIVASGSDLYAGGSFTSAGGIRANKIAKWSGNAWSSLGSGMNGTVRALAASGIDLYAGGEFQTEWGSGANHRRANYIAKWSGGAWSPLGSGMNNTVRALAVSGSDLYAAGEFTIVAGGRVIGCAARAVAIAGDWLRLWNGGPGSHTSSLNYIGVPDAQYLVQYATNLTTSPWFTLATNTVALDGRGAAMDFTATNTQRFYRVSSP